MSTTSSFSLLLLFWLTLHVHARIHHLVLKEDARQYFKVSTFGFLYGGSLRINVDNFSFSPYDESDRFGFTLLKTRNDGLHPYAKQNEVCILNQANGMSRFDDNIGIVSIIFDLQKHKVIFRCSALMKQLAVGAGFNNNERIRRDAGSSNNSEKVIAARLNEVARSVALSPVEKPKEEVKPEPSQKAPANDQENKPNVDSESVALSGAETAAKVPAAVLPESVNPDPVAAENNDNNSANDEDTNVDDNYCKNQYEVDLQVKEVSGVKSYSFAFHTRISDESLEGLYSLYFHSCPNYVRVLTEDRFPDATTINLSMVIEEKNYENYLSAGEIPLPQLYFTLSCVFFILGLIWMQLIRSRKEDAFKIHYLMGALVFVKALALFFHSVDYHFISDVGSQSETWAILYYTTHFFKGALLFITIVLIGTGWAFVKHILSDKDKKIFMIVIPLQVLANVAEIITEESEEGQFMHNIWRTVFLLVDLICCGAILFPIVWSIRHLQEASQTDGKAAINLRKLKLFRRFYVMIVCYIYFTRIIVFILRLIVPFQYEWLDVFFQHAATLVFFISTGYHFQPTHSNPYFQLSQQEDLEMEEVLFNVTPNVYIASTTKKRVKEKDNEVSEDRQTLITKRDNSHDFE